MTIENMDKVTKIFMMFALTGACAAASAIDYKEVDAYISAGEYEKAAEALAAMVAADPGNAQLHNDYGTALFQIGDYDRAVAEFEEAAGLDPTYASPLNNLGYYYMALENDARRAISYFVSAARLSRDDTALSNLYTCYASVGDIDGAIDAFKDLTETWPESARLRNDLGSLYLYKDDRVNARKYFEEAIALDPEYYHPVVNLARVEIEDGNYKTAEGLLEPLVDSGESRGSTLWDAWVFFHLSKGDADGAMAAAELSVEKEPGTESYNNLAAVYHLLNDHARAIDAAIRSLSYEETAFAHYIKGYSALLGGFKPEAAKEELARAVEMDPFDIDARYALAETLFNLRAYDEARDAYLTTFELDPEAADAYASAGIACFMAGDKTKAAEILYDALARFPDNPKSNHGVAVLLLDEGNWEEAIPYAEKAVELDDGYGDAYNTLSYLYAELGRFEDSYGALKRATETLTGEAFVQLNLGIAAYRTGRFDESADAFGRAIELAEPAAGTSADFTTATGQAYAGRAVARAKLGDFAGAQADADAAEAYVGEHSVILFARALVAGAEGDAATRDDLLELVVEMNEAVLAEGETLGAMSGAVYEEALALLGR